MKHDRIFCIDLKGSGGRRKRSHAVVREHRPRLLLLHLAEQGVLLALVGVRNGHEVERCHKTDLVPYLSVREEGGLVDEVSAV